ncbi:hypothetical protein [Gemmatimonas sp.]
MIVLAVSVSHPALAAAQGKSFACMAGADRDDERAVVHQRFGGRSPDSTWQRWRSGSTGNNLIALHDSVVQYWSRLSPAVPLMQRGAVTARLDSLRTELSLANAPGGPRVRRFVVDEVPDGDASHFQLFEDPLDPRAVVRESDADEMRLAMCGTTHLAWLVANLAGNAQRLQDLEKLQARAARWDNFEEHGQSMTPLELTVNTWCTACRKRAQLEPPHVQLIVGHVSPAFEISEWRTRGARGREALMVEWLGVLRYTRDRRHHYGVSLLSSFPSGGPSGLGATVRWSRIGQIGVVWPRDNSTRTYATVLSVDLYRFIASGKLADKRELASLIAGCTTGTKSCALP